MDTSQGRFWCCREAGAGFSRRSLIRGILFTVAGRLSRGRCVAGGGTGPGRLPSVYANASDYFVDFLHLLVFQCPDFVDEVCTKGAVGQNGHGERCFCAPAHLWRFPDKREGERSQDKKGQDQDPDRLIEPGFCLFLPSTAVPAERVGGINGPAAILAVGPR